MAALTQLQEEPVQPFCHGHLGWERGGSGSSSVVALLEPPSPSGIPKWECGKCRTYRVGLWLVEPAVSGAEQVQGHLGMGPHLRQAGQGLTHLQGWGSMWEDPCRKPTPSANPNEPPRPGWHQSCWRISEATTALDPSPSVEEETPPGDGTTPDLAIPEVGAMEGLHGAGNDRGGLPKPPQDTDPQLLPRTGRGLLFQGHEVHEGVACQEDIRKRVVEQEIPPGLWERSPDSPAAS